MDKDITFERDGYAVLKLGLSSEKCAVIDSKLAALEMESVDAMGVRFSQNSIKSNSCILQDLTFLSRVGLDKAEVLYDEYIEVGTTFLG